MLLLDENLSPRLAEILAAHFPGSIHVHGQQLGNVDDREIWEFARREELIIVTKDGDFPDIQGVKGFPPKLVWIRRGNRLLVGRSTLWRARLRERFYQRATNN